MEAACYSLKKHLYSYSIDVCLSFFFSAISWKHFQAINDKGSSLHFKVGYVSVRLQSVHERQLSWIFSDKGP